MRHLFTILSMLLLLLSTQYLQAAKQATKILFLGDSLTEGYGVSQKQSYPYQLQQMLSAKGYDIQIVVDGISGSTSSSGVSRIKNSLKYKPDYLFLALGANDGLRGLPTKQLKNNLAKIIDQASANGVKIILAGMQMPDNYGAFYVKKFKQVYHQLFEDYRKQTSIIFYPFLLDKVALAPNLNQQDGIHPNAEGHQMIATQLTKFFIKNVLK